RDCRGEEGAMLKYAVVCGSVAWLLLFTVGARTDPPAPRKSPPAPALALRDTFPSVWSARFSPDGTRLAICFDKPAAVWDTAMGTRLLTQKDHPTAVSVFAFDHGASRLAIGAYGGSLGV